LSNDMKQPFSILLSKGFEINLNHQVVGLGRNHLAYYFYHF